MPSIFVYILYLHACIKNICICFAQLLSLTILQILKTLEGKKDSFVRFASAVKPPGNEGEEGKVDISRETVESLLKKTKNVVDVSLQFTFELVRQKDILSVKLFLQTALSWLFVCLFRLVSPSCFAFRMDFHFMQ